MYSLEYLKEYFKNDVFATKMLGAKIVEAKDDYAKCYFDVNKDHQNAKGIVMGGAIFTLADFTFAVAVNQHEEYYTVSTTANISYFRPCIASRLYAEAIKVKDGKTICFYDVNVYDENDKLIAKVNITGTHVKR